MYYKHIFILCLTLPPPHTFSKVSALVYILYKRHCMGYFVWECVPVYYIKVTI